MRGMNNSVETVNAAATAIITAENRVQPSSVQKRRWGSCWGGYWCFGSHRNGKRIGHAVLVPEPMTSGTSAPDTDNVTHPPPIILPFIAPPSSPASFLQSEPPSVSQSPAGLLSLTSLTANAYSPGPNSIFAIGPYAHETQLVSPPVFSTFTTEPSTAPFTPPPEPVHMTTPSSPEVPFARLLTSSLDPNHRSSETGQKFPLSHNEFQSYQLYPGSPVGHLISPSSVISGSGTSSPFPDREFPSGAYSLLEFRNGEPPKLWKLDVLSTRKWGPQQGSGSLTPDGAGPISRDSFLPENHISEVASLANSDNGSQNEDLVVNQRVSFELTAEEAKTYVEKDRATVIEVASESQQGTTEVAAISERDGPFGDVDNPQECCVEQNSSNSLEKISGHGDVEEPHHQPEPSLTTIGSVKEFKFDNADGVASDKTNIGSDWWVNEKVVAKEAGARNNWAFFPMIQPGVS